MKSWGLATEGATAAGIKFVADGNGEFSDALGFVSDKTAGRMGMRCTRFAAVVESGKFTLLNVDAAGFEKSAAEEVLKAL